MTSGTQPQPRTWRVYVLGFLAGYITLHFALSRISATMVRRDWGIQDAFLYLPLKPNLVADHERPLLYIHHALNWFFLPALKLDQLAFNGPAPITSMPLRNISTTTPSTPRTTHD